MIFTFYIVIVEIQMVDRIVLHVSIKYKGPLGIKVKQIGSFGLFMRVELGSCITNAYT